MKRKTTPLAAGPAILSLVAVALFATSATAQELPQTEAQEMAAARQSALIEVERLLDDPVAEGRRGAISTLVDIACGYSVLPHEVERLLLRATGDHDPDVARLANRAWFNLERRGETIDARVPEDILLARSQLQELKQAQELLRNYTRDDTRDPGDRLGAVQTVVHLASAAPALSEEVTPLLRQLRFDADFDVAHLAEKALAQREGRAMDPALARPPVRSWEWAPDLVSVESDPFDGLKAERPSARLAALELILDAALTEGRRDAQKTIDAFVRLLDDPDPRVAYRAANALLGLAGDVNALRDVYVGDPGAPRAVVVD